MGLKVSVIVAAYNYGHFLRDALDSVIAQTMDDWECILVDDGSTDDTAMLGEQYALRDPRFRVIRQANRGVAASRNTALRQCRGTYIQFLDADDRLAARKLQTQTSYLDEHCEVDVVYGPTRFFRTEEPDKELQSLRGRLTAPVMTFVEGNAEARRILQEVNILQICASLSRRAVLERAGLFVETARACEDWDLWMRAAIVGARFRYVDTGAPLAFIRSHRSSLSWQKGRMMRGLIDCAHAFPATAAAREWQSSRLPLILEMALGVDEVDHGSRLRGAKRIGRAASQASTMPARIRWSAYAVFALVLPRSWALRLIMATPPELALEWYRKITVINSRLNREKTPARSPNDTP